MNKILVTIIPSLIVVLLVACQDESSIESDSQKQEADSTTSTNDDRLDEVVEENSSNTENSNDATSEPIESPNEKEVVRETPNSEATEKSSLREEYFKKLNEMEEADRHSDVGTTMVELEEQETERYEKWDKELNEIYAILQEQLSTEEMEKLREEQRNWITYRDEEAKAASLKYEGGSYESLEYVATQAILTRERCYELVAQYMK